MARKCSIGDDMKGAWRSIANGTAMNPLATMKEIHAAHGERTTYPPTNTGWYSKYVSGNDSVHLLLDRRGRITTARPHVHVIHDGARGYVEIILIHGDGRHEPSEFLDIDAGGTEIENKIMKVCAHLPSD